MRKWSVIICSINAAKFAHVTQCYERLLAGRSYEIIGIHDAASLCEGYNRGIAQASGDILVFSHDDVLLLDPGFADKVETRLGTHALLGFAGTTEVRDAHWWAAGTASQRGAVAHAAPGARSLSLFVYGVGDEPVDSVQAIDGMCMVAHRRAVNSVQFDATTFDGFHLYDMDFSYRVHLAGLGVGVMNDSPIIHMSSGDFDAVWDTYRERFLYKHADALGLGPDAVIPAPQPIQARAADFQSPAELIAAWQPRLLRRATIALLRGQT
ncbi:glycosyltransferase [Uliginosibacterium sp. H3]|uniref:Glycosyltransferase n=1 Tax=Uliginosibacterium silvisoli TaxID=3114758 RepID=A0ABU6K902_9RHOO|nr:glycosyltransferase [Uliginosibacterium sp. H3]